MGTIIDTGNSVWRDYVTDGVSGSGAHDPIKSEIRDFVAKIDAISQATVINMTTTVPPGSPTNGDAYVVAPSATGAWSGLDDDLAIYSNGWLYITPAEGFVVYDQDTNLVYIFDGSSWIPVAAGVAFLENTFSPTLTFATPGDLAVTYSVRTGSYTKIGKRILYDFAISTSAFTHTTAAGILQITGLPTAGAAVGYPPGACTMSGWTKAGYSTPQIVMIQGQAYCHIQVGQSGVPTFVLTKDEVPTGATVVIGASGSYRID